MEHIKALVGVVETYGGTCRNEPGLITAQLIEQGQPGSTNPDKIKKAEAMCPEQYLPCMILQGSDSTRYYQLKTNLANDLTEGSDNFQNSIVEVVDSSTIIRCQRYTNTTQSPMVAALLSTKDRQPQKARSSAGTATRTDTTRTSALSSKFWTSAFKTSLL
jgi:hypothetical protein